MECNVDWVEGDFEESRCDYLNDNPDLAGREITATSPSAPPS